jgi:hypothetical protein
MSRIPPVISIFLPLLVLIQTLFSPTLASFPFSWAPTTKYPLISPILITSITPIAKIGQTFTATFSLDENKTNWPTATKFEFGLFICGAIIKEVPKNVTVTTRYRSTADKSFISTKRTIFPFSQIFNNPVPPNQIPTLIYNSCSTRIESLHQHQFGESEFGYTQSNSSAENTLPELTTAMFTEPNLRFPNTFFNPGSLPADSAQFFSFELSIELSIQRFTAIGESQSYPQAPIIIHGMLNHVAHLPITLSSPYFIHQNSLGETKQMVRLYYPTINGFFYEKDGIVFQDALQSVSSSTLPALPSSDLLPKSNDEERPSTIHNAFRVMSLQFRNLAPFHLGYNIVVQFQSEKNNVALDPNCSQISLFFLEPLEPDENNNQHHNDNTNDNRTIEDLQTSARPTITAIYNIFELTPQYGLFRLKTTVGQSDGKDPIQVIPRLTDVKFLFSGCKTLIKEYKLDNGQVTMHLSQQPQEGSSLFADGGSAFLPTRTTLEFLIQDYDLQPPSQYHRGIPTYEIISFVVVLTILVICLFTLLRLVGCICWERSSIPYRLPKNTTVKLLYTHKTR